MSTSVTARPAVADELHFLLARFVREGDEDAMASLVDRTRPRLLAAARGIAGSADAEDCVQAAYLSLVRRGLLPADTPVRAWLLTAVVRIAYRRKAKARRLGDVAERLAEQRDAKSPMETAAASEEVELLLAELTSLPASYRDPIVLHHLQGLSTAEVAELLDIPRASVKTRLHRGRALLRGRLAPRIKWALCAGPWTLIDLARGVGSGVVTKGAAATTKFGGGWTTAAALVAIAIPAAVAGWMVASSEPSPPPVETATVTEESPPVDVPTPEVPRFADPPAEPPTAAKPPRRSPPKPPVLRQPAPPATAIAPRDPAPAPPPKTRAKPKTAWAEEAQEIWDKYAGEKKNGYPFRGLGFYLDRDRLKDSRWSRSDSATGPSNFDNGPQLSAQWAAANTEGWAIAIDVFRWEQKNSAKKSKGVYPFENIGKRADVADVGRMCEYMYQDWIAASTDVVKKRGKKPGKAKGAGPAKQYASATATDAGTKRRERRDWYLWTERNATYMARIRFDQSVLKNDEITDKARDFMRALKEIKDKLPKPKK